MARAIFFTTASLVTGLFAALFALVVVSTPWQVERSLEKSRTRFEDLKAASFLIEDFRQRTGENPSGDVLEKLETKSRPSIIDGYLGIDNVQPGDNYRSACNFQREEAPFVSPPSDHLVLFFWSGENYDCYSHPSGHTTMSMSWRDFLSNSMFWSVWASFVGMSALFAVMSAWCWRKRRAFKPIVAI